MGAPKKNEGGQPGNKNAEKWTEQIALDLGNELINWIKLDDNIFFEDFLYIVKDLHPNIIGYLSKKYKSFNELLKRSKKIQELKLVKLGIKDKLQPAMTIFVLKNHHNYKDKQEITADITTTGPKKIGFDGSES